MKQLKIKGLFSLFFGISLLCFIYLNTRSVSSAEMNNRDFTSINNEISDFEKEDKSSHHILKASMIIILKSILLSDK
ncbi:MAG TPA: hypothetical protein PKD85_08525 [Saprospiraceae bacterium]|nr:hypothetical protein [Saprospiraceae bacterium]